MPRTRRHKLHNARSLQRALWKSFLRHITCLKINQSWVLLAKNGARCAWFFQNIWKVPTVRSLTTLTSRTTPLCHYPMGIHKIGDRHSRSITTSSGKGKVLASFNWLLFQVGGNRCTRANQRERSHWIIFRNIICRFRVPKEIIVTTDHNLSGPK